MDENITKTKKSKYNMSMFIMQHLGHMLVNAANYYRLGYIDKWFFEWKNIKYQIIAELEGNERTSLENKEIDIAKFLNIKDFTKATPLIEKYLTEIQDYIKNKEIGLADKPDETIFT